MAISALVVDDEQLAREELVFLLKDVDVEVIAQGKNGVEAVNLIKELSPDLVFLDVQMPGLDGFGVIKKLLDKKVPLPQIVFATAYDQYAVRAFEVNAVDYLLKPFDKKRVAQAVNKARQKLEKLSRDRTDRNHRQAARAAAASDPDRQGAAQGSGQAIPGRSKRYLLCLDPRRHHHCRGGNMEGQSNCRTLEELLDSLDPNMFWRAHRSYLVNINRIKEVVPWFKSSYQIRMDDKKQAEIPVSRAQTKRLRELFGL